LVVLPSSVAAKAPVAVAAAIGAKVGPVVQALLAEGVWAHPATAITEVRANQAARMRIP